MTTFETSLAGVSGVNELHAYTFPFGLVADEGLQLRKRPTVEAASLFTLPLFGPTANVRQVLQNDSSTSRNAIDNTTGQDMVTDLTCSLEFTHFLPEGKAVGFWKVDISLNHQFGLLSFDDEMRQDTFQERDRSVCSRDNPVVEVSPFAWVSFCQAKMGMSWKSGLQPFGKLNTRSADGNLNRVNWLTVFVASVTTEHDAAFTIKKASKICFLDIRQVKEGVLCWLPDLVKAFLFAQLHLANLAVDGYRASLWETFTDLRIRGITVVLAKPFQVILGIEFWIHLSILFADRRDYTRRRGGLSMRYAEVLPTVGADRVECLGKLARSFC